MVRRQPPSPGFHLNERGPWSNATVSAASSPVSYLRPSGDRPLTSFILGYWRRCEKHWFLRSPLLPSEITQLTCMVPPSLPSSYQQNFPHLNHFWGTTPTSLHSWKPDVFSGCCIMKFSLRFEFCTHIPNATVQDYMLTDLHLIMTCGPLLFFPHPKVLQLWVSHPQNVASSSLESSTQSLGQLHQSLQIFTSGSLSVSPALHLTCSSLSSVSS